MSGGPVARRLREELTSPVSKAATHLTEALRARFGDATAAVLFYGSCLRRGSAEGVLDFYVLVDDYASAYPGRGLALLNRLTPPNVFYIEIDAVGSDEHEVAPPEVGTEKLRAKVAVLSLADFEKAVMPGWWEARVWARFAQPARLVYTRNDEVHDLVERAVAVAVRTFVGHAEAWLGDDEGGALFDAQVFWTRAFSETYRAEFRTEKPETIAALFAAAPERYRGILDEVLREEPSPFPFSAREAEGEYEIQLDPATLRAARKTWHRSRRRGKAVAALGLLKSILTFDDWASYGLWKLERHRGAPIAISDRQRRHPILLGWPVLWRVLREKTLR